MDGWLGFNGIVDRNWYSVTTIHSAENNMMK